MIQSEGLIPVMVTGEAIPWWLTPWGMFGVILIVISLSFGIVIGWGLHKNKDLLRRWIFG